MDEAGNSERKRAMTNDIPELTEQQWQILTNEGWGWGPVNPDIQMLADLGLVTVTIKPWKHDDGAQAWSYGPTEAGARMGPYPERYGHPPADMSRSSLV